MCKLAALCVLLTAACWFDYRKKKIPNFLIAAMLITGLAWRAREEGWLGAAVWLGQVVLVMLLLYFLFRISALGAGDVKLFGAAAGFLPFKKLFLFLFVSLLVAALLSLWKLWRNKDLGKRLRHLAGYLGEVQKGGWRAYPQGGLELEEAGIRLSGPVLVGLLLYMGGVY